MDIYKIIVNDPIYSIIAVLLALIFIFSIIKRYSRLILGAASLIIIYLSYIFITGQNIPASKEDLKEQINKDLEKIQKKMIDK